MSNTNSEAFEAVNVSIGLRLADASSSKLFTRQVLYYLTQDIDNRIITDCFSVIRRSWYYFWSWELGVGSWEFGIRRWQDGEILVVIELAPQSISAAV